MPKTAAELRQDRTAIVAQARQMVEKATAENRDLSPEEGEKFRELTAKADQVGAQIQTAETREWVEAQEAAQNDTRGRRVPATRPGATRAAALDEHQAAEFFRSWTLAEAPDGRPEADVIVRAADHGFNVNSRTVSFRSLTKGTTTAGGHTVPQSFSSELDKQLAYFFVVGEAVDQFATEDGRDYPWPTINDSGNSAAQVAEEGTIGSTTDPTFGQIVYKSFDYFSPIAKVSYQLLRDSARDIPALLAELFAERMGRSRSASVVSANAGTTAPEGMLNGVSVGVNLATGNPITLAKLLALESSVDLAYRNLPGSGFMMHDGTWQNIRGLSDTAGRPLLNINLAEGVEKRLLGYKVALANTMTSIDSPGDNQPLMLFGALKKYKVRRIGGSTLTRLNELYAATGQVGFMLHEAWDGRWVTKAGVRTLNSFDSP